MAKTRYSYKYNGQVVRNSNRLYKYGLVNHNDEVIACSSTEQGALKERTWWLNHLSRELQYFKKNKPEYVTGCERDISNTEKWHLVDLEVVEN